ncbi:glycosyltransferase family 2 protein [Marinovum sp.]|uniref:glycosyltransferase family 2 protein n=1 Tax=Marinovum sp. TaxID=2024839 RepID=UPI002B26D4EC|nr:glycosyltransferase family 2 protein [Marinovum sp.]
MNDTLHPDRMPDPSAERSPTYDDGIDGVLAQMEARREPLKFSKRERLPGLDVDFAPLKAHLVPPPADDPLRAAPVRSSNRRKLLEIREELAGRSELCALHGLLIAHLRKSGQPEHTAALFHRIWAEEHDHLLDQLDPRWLVSALTTFGDHGQTEVQRRVGQAMTVLFGTMKLYESERRYSGLSADRPFALTGKDRGPLPLEMDAFHLPAGGLDVNMLGRLWIDAGEDDVLRPLARHLLDLLIHDPRTVFRRLRIMRKRKERRDAAQTADQAADTDSPEAKITAPVPHVPPRRGPLPTWGVVCTTHAPLAEIQRFAAHYLHLGASRVTLYLDSPAPEVGAFFAGHAAIEVITCDADFWQTAGKRRPEAHQLRQAHNATQAYRASELDFLGHFDTDEFLLPEVEVARGLRFMPENCAQARVRPVELLAAQDGPPRHFKRSHRQAGVPRAALSEIYPNYGAYLTGGFVSHTSGKVFARTRLADVRFGIHGLRLDGMAVGNEADLPRMKLAHCHAASFDHFRDRVRFRLTRGSYRKPEDDDAMRLGDVLDFVLDTEGDAGLRHFFDEVCSDSAALRERLARHDMLVTQELDLDARVREVFGPRATAAGAA